MNWLIVAPFIHDPNNGWLGDFVPGERHRFTTIAAEHSVSGGPRTSAAGWRGHFRHARAALREARRRPRTGLITAFPQLPVAAGLLSLLAPRRTPIIAWTFNIGHLPGPLKRAVSVLALRRVDAVIVHSRKEIDEYSAFFKLPRDKVFFVPLQRIIPRTTSREDTADPYLISLGSANRDYALLFKVLAAQPMRTIVVASPDAVAGLDIPPCVEVRSGLKLQDCHELLQGARASVVPVANPTTASGQVTLLNSMGLGRPTIVTRCPGSVDYVVDGETALLVEPGDAADLARALALVWNDDARRAQLGERGRRHVAENYSDEAIGRIMGEICDVVEARWSARLPAAQ